MKTGENYGYRNNRISCMNKQIIRTSKIEKHKK